MLLQSSTFLIHFLSFYLSLTLSLSLSSQHSFPEESDSRQKRIFRENPNPNPDPKDPLRIYPHILLAWPWKSDPNLKIPFSDFKVSLSLSLVLFLKTQHYNFPFKETTAFYFLFFNLRFIASWFYQEKKKKQNKEIPFWWPWIPGFYSVIIGLSLDFYIFFNCSCILC